MRYTLTDRLEDLKYDLYMNWPGRFAPLASVRALAVAANFARLCGADRTARRLAAWAYDVADIPLTSAAFNLHRTLMPWAWNADRTLLASWCYSPKVLEIVERLRGNK